MRSSTVPSPRSRAHRPYRITRISPMGTPRNDWRALIRCWAQPISPSVSTRLCSMATERLPKTGRDCKEILEIPGRSMDSSPRRSFRNRLLCRRNRRIWWWVQRRATWATPSPCRSLTSRFPWSKRSPVRNTIFSNGRTTSYVDPTLKHSNGLV